jgi:hypothetical protein
MTFDISAICAIPASLTLRQAQGEDTKQILMLSLSKHEGGAGTREHPPS